MSSAPKTIPALIDQNRKAISIGSLIAVRNLTIDNAPTIPRDRTTFEVIAKIISVVIRVIERSEVPKLSEYITPLKVFLYTKNIKRPIAKANPSAITVSNKENVVAFSKKLDLKISLKLNWLFPFIFITSINLF